MVTIQNDPIFWGGGPKIYATYCKAMTKMVYGNELKQVDQLTQSIGLAPVSVPRGVCRGTIFFRGTRVTQIFSVRGTRGTNYRRLSRSQLKKIPPHPLSKNHIKMVSDPGIGQTRPKKGSFLGKKNLGAFGAIETIFTHSLGALTRGGGDIMEMDHPYYGTYYGILHNLLRILRHFS